MSIQKIYDILGNLINWSKYKLDFFFSKKGCDRARKPCVYINKNYSWNEKNNKARKWLMTYGVKKKGYIYTASHSTSKCENVVTKEGVK